MAVMAWFKKERKPRTSQRERLEIPADAWEKCDSCGHIDIREKFEKALNVCPECGRHRRIGAEEYIDLLTEMHGTQAWQDLLESNGWIDAFATGDDFAAFLRDQDERVETTLKELGLV